MESEAKLKDWSTKPGGTIFSDEPTFDQAYEDVREELLDIYAPAGKLGVVIDTPDDGAPVVHAVKDTSPIGGRLDRRGGREEPQQKLAEIAAREGRRDGAAGISLALLLLIIDGRRGGKATDVVDLDIGRPLDEVQEALGLLLPLEGREVGDDVGVLF